MHEYFIHLCMNICEKMSVCLQVCLFFTISTSFYFVYFFRQTLLPDQFTLYRTFMAKKKNIISSSTTYQQYIVVAIHIIICSLWRSLSLSFAFNLFTTLSTSSGCFDLIYCKKMLCFSIFQRLYCLLPHFYTYTSIYTLTYVCMYS